MAILPTLEAGLVNCCVTSPPYWGLRDYGVAGQLGLEKTPEEYVAKLVAVFREVRRVLRVDGTLWLNLGDSYSNDTKWGGTSLKPKDLVGIPWRVAFALQADGWYLRSDIIWSKPNPMPESVTDRCTKAHEYIFMLSKSPRYFFDHEAIKEPLANASIGRAERKQKLIDRDGVGTLGKQIRDGVDGTHGYAGLALGRNGKTGYSEDGKRNKHSVWTVTTKPFKGAHFATFPPKLIEPCILAGCPEGGTVLDPFNGAGTTGMVALQHRRNYVGIELKPEYVTMAKRRLSKVQPLLVS